MPNRRAEGAAAEDRAADYLLAKGYTLVTRRRKSGSGEIDLVCLDGETLVFVEVKARWRGDYVPEESLNSAKIGHLRSAAQAWAAENEVESRVWRFDLVAIDRGGLRHYEDVLAL